MKISVIGLGYVGIVCSAVLARNGHHIIGVDKKNEHNACINKGEAPIYEPGLEELICANVAAGRLSARDDLESAILDTGISIICVGTPSRNDGSVDLSSVRAVLTDVGHILKSIDQFYTIVMRSTVPPGTGQEMSIPLLESISGKKVGIDFGYASFPEFLREGVAINDFDFPPMTVIGASDKHTVDVVSSLVHRTDAPLIKTSISVAEMTKYASNAWHATKVAFANEMGNISKQIGIDGQEVMSVFCEDTKLNLSPYYLMPAFAFGGSCLPKDVKALASVAHELGLTTPVLSSLLESNREQIKRGYDLVAAIGRKKIAMLGISFKADTDDFRESPQVKLVNQLIDTGYEIKVYDQNILNSLRYSPMRAQLRKALGRVADLMVSDLDKMLNDVEVIVIGNLSREFRDIPKRFVETLPVVDLVRIVNWDSHGNYHGICW